MSGAPQVRRADKLMTEERARETLAHGFCGRLATVGKDGWPYCVPLLYVCMNGEVFVHNTRAAGHLRTNVDHEQRVCFEVDEAGEVFPYGRFECDSTVAYRSVIVFGRIRVVEDLATRRRFFDALMAKYALQGTDPALDRLALIVRGADTADKDLTPESRGLDAIAGGFQQMGISDHEKLEKEFPVYDALYVYCGGTLPIPQPPLKEVAV